MQALHILLSDFLRAGKLVSEAETHGLAVNAVEEAFIKNSDHAFDLMEELKEPGVHKALVEWMVHYYTGDQNNLSGETIKTMSAFVSNDSMDLLKHLMNYIKAAI